MTDIPTIQEYLEIIKDGYPEDKASIFDDVEEIPDWFYED
jgi:hypothetical protein